MAEKQRFIERDEQQRLEEAQRQQQQQIEMQQQQLEQQAQLEQAKMQQTDDLNARDNETKILVAEINSQAEADRLALMNNDTDDGSAELNRDKLMQSIKEFDAKLKLDRDKFEFDKQKTREELRLKEKQINKKPNTSK
jgi:hypothetical protein